MNTLTAGSGTYLLLLKCTRTAKLRVGKPGKINTYPGSYLYVGSAGGIQASDVPYSLSSRIDLISSSVSTIGLVFMLLPLECSTTCCSAEASSP